MMKVPITVVVVALVIYMFRKSVSSPISSVRHSEKHHNLNGSINIKVRNSQSQMYNAGSMIQSEIASEFKKSTSKDGASTISPVTLTRVLMPKLSLSRYSRLPPDVGHHEPEFHANTGTSRRLQTNRSGKGKGSNKVDTKNNLNICLKRQFNNDETVKNRSVQNTSENVSQSNGRSSDMRKKGKKKRSRNRNNRCKSSVSKPRGKGDSRKSKKSKGQESNICIDYDFSDRRQNSVTRDEINNILDVARGIPRLSIFVDLVERSSIETVLDCSGPFTVLIPANRAFRTLGSEIFADLLWRDKSKKLDDILLSHIIPGEKFSREINEGILETINGDTILATVNPLILNNNVTVGTGDIVAGNGVIHVIDTVLFTNVSKSVCDSGLFDFEGPSCGRGCTENIIDIACVYPQLSTFLSLIELSGLEEVFECNGPFTLFVPHNDAFDDMRGHLWIKLLQPENINDLKSFLLYHIVPGSFFRRDLKSGEMKSVFFDANITISRNPLMINHAKIVVGDFLACNGVLHIINRVLDHTQQMLELPPPPTPSMVEPSAVPTLQLPTSQAPTKFPSKTFSVAPTSSSPTKAPESLPTKAPTPSPSEAPITQPNEDPSKNPSSSPTSTKSQFPTADPSIPPSASPSASPSRGVVRVNIDKRFFFAYVTSSSDEPTESEYKEVRQITITHYNDFISRSLALTRPDADFIRWNATLSNTKFNAGIPLRRFNIFMEYTMAVAIYTKESQTVPSSDEFLKLLNDGFVYEYLKKLMSLKGSPFELVNEGVFSDEVDDD